MSGASNKLPSSKLKQIIELLKSVVVCMRSLLKISSKPISYSLGFNSRLQRFESAKMIMDRFNVI